RARKASSRRRLRRSPGRQRMTVPKPELRTAHVWRGTLVAGRLNTCGSPLDILVGRQIPEYPLWPAILSSVVGLTVIGVLLARRRFVGVRTGSLLFVVNNTAVVAQLWVTSGFYAAAAPHWTPFQANKLGALAVALLAP